MDIIVPKTIGQGSVTRNSVASYVNSSGNLTYAPINTVRINYDPNNLSAIPSPLLEQAATNQTLSSEHLEYPFNPTLTGSSIKYRTQLAPDKTLSADVLVEATATGVHSIGPISPQSTLDNTIPVVYSVFAKASGRTQLRITGVDAFTFDLSAGTVTAVGTPTVNQAGITSFGNGWYRCYVSYPSGYGGSNTPGWILSTSVAGSNSYAGDGQSGVMLFGFQYENNANRIATSYIPTSPVFTSRTGNSTLVTSAGLVTPSGTTARLSYSPSNLSASPKLLLEDASTNLVIQSAVFSSAWTATTTTVTSGAGTSPAGTITATSLSGTNGSVSKILQNMTVTNSNKNYVFSLFVKKTSGATSFPGVGLSLTAGTSVLNSAVTINTDTGVLAVSSTSVNVSYKNVQDYGTFWRVSVGVTNNTTGNTVLAVSVYPVVNNDASSTWASGISGSALIWGAQVEESIGYETSYIPTTTTSQTRGADIFTDSTATRQKDVLVFGLLYSNIPENDYPVWSATTTYAIGDNVIYQHKIYNSLRASNLNFNPATDTTTPAYWLYTGPTNQYAMFDGQVGTLTTNNSGDIVVELYIGATTAVSFNQISADSVTVTLIENGNTIYNTTLDVTGGTTGVPVTDICLTDLPSVSDAVMYVTIHAASGIVSCGNFVAGIVYYLGSTSTDPTIGITDYSIKTNDAFGNPTLTKRAYSKTMNTKSLLLTPAQTDLVARILSDNRATPCVWNGNTSINNRTSNLYSSLIVYGYYNTWEIDVDTNNTYLTLQIEGLI